MRYNKGAPGNVPDPRVRRAEQLRLMPVPVMGLVPQPALDDARIESISTNSDQSGLRSMTVGISYTLWRNPHDHSDPANLVELNDETRLAIEQTRSAPPWVRDQVDRARYPMVWNAVKTAWNRDPVTSPTPQQVLLDHTNNVLTNQFRKELGLADITADRFAARLNLRAVNAQATLRVDSIDQPAFEIDTDPYVYAIGTTINPGTVVTVVLPRTELSLVRIELTRSTTWDL